MGFELGTDETVLRGVDHRLTQSPSIKDLTTINHGGSIVSVLKEPNALEKPDHNPDVGFFSLRPIQPEIVQTVTPRSGSYDDGK